MSVMNVRRLIPTTAVAGAVVLGLTALSACSTSDAADGGNGDKLKVTASFYPMQFLTERIGGEHVAVTSLTKPGVEPHDLELTPARSAPSASPTTCCTSRASSPPWTTPSSSPV